MQDYSYRDLRRVDWKRRFVALGRRLRAAGTALEFAGEAAKLLGPAQDPHLWLRVGRQTVPTYRRCAQRNVDLSALPGLVRSWRQHNEVVMSGSLAEGVAYLCLRAWPGHAPHQLRPAYRVLRQAAAARQSLIIDVRANGGGAEPLAARFAGCFVGGPVCYAKHLTMRAGKLTGPFERWVKPNQAGPRHRGRVAVLVGPGTVSSCESFVMMMRRVPGCKLIGQRTAGSSGNPKPVDLGNGVVLFVPSWQDLDLHGACLEGRGVEPDVDAPWPFEGEAGRGRSSLAKARSLQPAAHEPSPRADGRQFTVRGLGGPLSSRWRTNVDRRCFNSEARSADPVLEAALEFLRR
ncbi:MAG: S41 family peptidase [Limisphaerales bacterium]